ncbi:MAG: NADH-quinone oxidoreductase subunit NuoH [Anaerolineae bacterium]|nr:NADH-quinone oxidoreductase subunit NuoH [Anaerolineae bacterium]
MFNVDPNVIVECSANSTCSIVWPIIVSALLFFTLLTGFAYTTLLERRFLSFLQQRVGPNRAGPQGFLQPLADGIKLIFKEDVTPHGADRAVFWLAPVMKTVPAILVVAVIPLGPPILIPWFDGLWYRVPLGLADVNVGVLFILAWMSLGTYGVVLAGWSSNNKYSMLGAMRASAQMVSYELSMGLTMAVPILIAGSMSIKAIIDGQAYPSVLGWYVFQNPVSAAILMIAMLAETNRAPFDLPEAESELTAGYHTEYSGMKFALFFMAEYISMISVSMIVIALFFGGYHFALVDQVPILGPLVYAGKVVLFLMGMIWVRATLPRIRYDRLMAFGWKVLVPLALISVGWSAISLIIGDTFNSPALYFAISALFFIIVIAGVFIVLRPKPESHLRGDEVVLQPRGFGYVILQVVGGLLSIPLVIFGVTQKQLHNMQAALRPEKQSK